MNRDFFFLIGLNRFADLQGSAPSFEEDSAVLGVKKELNCVPFLPELMQKGVYWSYTPRFSITEALGSSAVGD